MERCEVCGNEYDKAFKVLVGDQVPHLRLLRVRHPQAGADL